MAISKVVFTFFLLSALLLQFVQALPTPPGTVAISPAPGALIDCDAACIVRCSKSSRPNLCQRVCGTCCKRCNCVPPGTYGNYDTCLCYASMTTHNGNPKCP